MKNSRVLVALFLLVGSAFGQTKKSVILNDIWGRNAGVFTQRTVGAVNWMKSGGFYTTLDAGKIVKLTIVTGLPMMTDFIEKNL